MFLINKFIYLLIHFYQISNLLSDGVKKEFIRNIEINDQLQIGHELENLFNNNESQDYDTFWNLARGASLIYPKTALLPQRAKICIFQISFFASMINFVRFRIHEDFSTCRKG